MKINKIYIIISTLCVVVLAILSFYLFRLNKTSESNIAMLQTKLTDLNEKDMKTVIVRRISKQMEEIAYQQKDLSDKQREEAVTQTKIATDMRSRAEIERENALNSEQKAIGALDEAQKQRLQAQRQRENAERLRRETDSLNYRTLARSLASLSLTQNSLGKEDLASLLAYTSWIYTNRYKGDILFPALLNSLYKSSHQISSWNNNKGGITCILPYPIKNSASKLITVSNYGEIYSQYNDNGRLVHEVLFSEPKYDFKDMYIENNGIIHALSYNGELVSITPQKKISFSFLTGNHFLSISSLENNEFLVVSENSLFWLQKNGMNLLKEEKLKGKVTAVGKRNNYALVFMDNGTCYYVGNKINGKFSIGKDVKVTAYSESDRLNCYALGLSNGDIYLIDKTTNKRTNLRGHLSAITHIEFVNDLLFSSSYDCTLRLWDVVVKRMHAESIILKTTSSWIHCFNNIIQDKSLFVGEENGELTRISIDPKSMAMKIKNSLTRDFTKEEWNFYIGESIPFESFKK